MSLARDLSDFPKDVGRYAGDGWAPDTNPRFGPVLVNKWHEEGIERDLHFRDGQDSRFFHSSAGSCSRAIGYAALRLPESNPMDAPGHFITRQGQILHDELQAVIQEVYPDARIEVEVSAGEDMGGHVDIEIEVVGDLLHSGDDTGDTYATKLVSVEAKSLGGFKYKKAIGDRYAPLGPDYSHVIQASLNARASNADEAVILYLARDAVSIQGAARKKLDPMLRVTAEWTLTREVYEPIADKEIERIKAILALLDEGTLPARKIPDPELPHGAVIIDPRQGTYTVEADDRLTDTGTTWHCLYCRWQDTCAKTSAGRGPVSQLVEIGAMK